MLYAGDERRHNNPNLAYVDADFTRGGGRVTANLQTLLTDFTAKSDQLKENVTTVYVISEDKDYRLKNLAQIGNLTNGWAAVNANVDLSGKADKTYVDQQNAAEQTARQDADSNLQSQITSNATAITSEISARQNADTNLQNQVTANATAISSETTARQNADAGLQSQITANTTAITTKEDKLISFYTTQTTSFNIAADMVDKVVRCNNATVTITANIANDALFTVGSKFILRQSGLAPVSIVGSGITFNAPQGTATARQFSYLQIIKQANNIYSVTVVGDDPTKQDKTAGKGLSTEDYTTVDKTKLLSIQKGFTLAFIAPTNTLPPDYFENSAQIQQIILNGASAFSYSINNGTSYITPTLPLTAGTYINISAGTWVKFRVTFSLNATNASAYIKLA